MTGSDGNSLKLFGLTPMGGDALNGTSPFKSGGENKIKQHQKHSSASNASLQNAVLVSIYLLVWISASVLGTILNKQIVKKFKFPITLTVMHLLAGYAFDLVLLKKNHIQTKVHGDTLLAALPVGIMLSLGKMFTYFSYGKIPVSLTHTVKVS